MAGHGDDPLPSEPWTELGYARRLIFVYGDRLRFVPAWRKWLVWGGIRWTPDTTGQAARWCKVVARRLTTAALAVTDSAERNTLERLARRGESSAGIAGALTLASTEPEVAVSPDDLDADPFLLNCSNGTLDLRTGELREHDPADLITKVTAAAYRPDAAGAEWVKFLDRVQPDPDMRNFLARLLGHALEGRVVEHVLPIHFGPGANGKTTWSAVFSSVHKVRGCRLVILTSAGEPSHWSHKVLAEAKRSKAWRVNEVPGPLPWIDPAALEAQRPLLLESEFARLQLNVWTQAEDRLVSAEDLAAAAVLGGPQAAQRGVRYVVTLDVGLTNNACVAVVAHAEPVDGNAQGGGQRRVLVDRLARWRGSKRAGAAV